MSALCLLERYVEDRGEGSMLAVPYENFPPTHEETFFDYKTVKKYIKDKYYTFYDDNEYDKQSQRIDNLKVFHFNIINRLLFN
jgi:hypothetical protein